MFEGNISSPQNSANSDLLSVIFKNNLKNIGIDNINFRSENNFSFRLEKKFKISNFKVDSKIDLKKLIYKKKSNTLKNHITGSGISKGLRADFKTGFKIKSGKGKQSKSVKKSISKLITTDDTAFSTN